MLLLSSGGEALAGADVIVSSLLTINESLAIAQATHAAWMAVILTPALVKTGTAPIPVLPPSCCCPRAFNLWTYHAATRLLWSRERDGVNAWRQRALQLAAIHARRQ